MLRNKIIRFKKIYKFYLDHFLIKWTVFVLNMKNFIKNQKLNFSDKLCDIQKKCWGTKLSVLKRSTNFILTIFWKEFNHFFKSRSSDIVLLKVGNLHQNAKRYERRNTERVARSATTIWSRALGALILASEARDENVRAKRADFFFLKSVKYGFWNVFGRKIAACINVW